MESIGKHYVISGRVQGVFFRDSTRKKAIELGITGWVKNSPLGHVECKAFGTTDQIGLLEDWLWQGPPKAEVNSVQDESIPYEIHDSFEINYKD